MVKIFAGAGVLGCAPLLDGGIVPVFEPTVVVGDFDAMVFVGDGTLRRVGRLGEFGLVSKRVNPSLREGGEGNKESEENLREASALHATSLRRAREIILYGELSKGSWGYPAMTATMISNYAVPMVVGSFSSA